MTSVRKAFPPNHQVPGLYRDLPCTLLNELILNKFFSVLSMVTIMLQDVSGFFFFLHIAIVYSHCHMTHAIWTHHDLLCIVPVWANLNSAAVSFRVHICTQMYIHISGGYRSTNEILESEGMPVFICGRPCPTAFQNGCCSLFFAINWEDQLFLILDNSWYHRSHFLPF